MSSSIYWDIAAKKKKKNSSYYDYVTVDNKNELRYGGYIFVLIVRTELSISEKDCWDILQCN